MGKLATYLAGAFCEQCPKGWTARREVVLAPGIGPAIGCKPHADVCLTNDDASRRIWIEFEISRADPVANHIKFAVAHGFTPQSAGDAFVSMMSSHIVVGRRSLGSAAVLLMRHVGMSAFQTLLLPRIGPADIASLNGFSPEQLRGRELPVDEEIARVLKVTFADSERPQYRIHFAADVGEVLMNVRRWNEEVKTDLGRALWRRKQQRIRVQYFVHDEHSKQFAPSKFCAFIPIPRERAVEISGTGFASAYLMSMALYAELDESEPRFDGTRAWTHLEKNLSMTLVPLAEAEPRLREEFAAWCALHEDVLGVREPACLLRLPASLR